MLPDHCRKLLTAHVDGELSARETKVVERLLRESAEARGLLRDLERDASAIRALPEPPVMDLDLSIPIIQSIRSRKLRPARRAVSRPTLVGYPVWGGLAAAASVLLLVGLASYLFFLASFAEPEANLQTQQVAKAQPPSTAKPTQKAEPEPEAVVVVPQKDPETPPSEQVVMGPPEPEKSPAPPREDTASLETTHAAPSKEMFKTEQVQIDLPLVLQLSRLDQEVGWKELVGELKKESAYRIELPCKLGTKAFDKVTAALKEQNCGLIVDPVAQARLKLPQLRTNYVLFLEDLTPEDVAKLLARAAAEDRKASKAAERQLESVVVSRMTPHDRKEITALLGVDPVPVTATRSSAPLGVDVTRPLNEQTATQVTRSLEGQGGRPDTGKPAVKAPERFALALAYNPVRPRSGSPEVKRFLDSRKPVRPGAVQVLLVLRGA